MNTDQRILDSFEDKELARDIIAARAGDEQALESLCLFMCTCRDLTRNTIQAYLAL